MIYDNMSLKIYEYVHTVLLLWIILPSFNWFYLNRHLWVMHITQKQKLQIF